MRWISFFLCINFYAQAETISVALPFEGNPPYSFGEKAHRGIYIDIFEEVFKHTPYQLEFVYLSSARIRSNFIEGKIDIECCPIPAWRIDEKAISIYSEQLLKTEDIYVFPQGKTRIIKALENETIATIHGYGYAFDTIFKRYDVESELKLLKLIDRDRLNVGIVDRAIVMHISKTLQLNIETGQVHEQSFRPIRIHKSKAHIVPIINQAIKKVKQQGTIKAIIDSYIIASDGNK